jgi:vacuolar-type H+-ATPase subunit H
MTSIKWLIKELNQELNYIPITQWDKIRDLIQQAKEMHKQEIEDAYNKCYQDLSNTQKEVDKLALYASQLPQQETFVSKGTDDHISDISKMVEMQQTYTLEQMKLAFEYGKTLEPFDSFEEFINSLSK